MQGREEPIIEVRDLEKSILERPVLRVQRLVLRRGESLAIVGLSEAEAELLMHHLTGRYLPDAGEVWLFGTRTADIQSEREWFPYLQRIGLYDERIPLMEEWPVEVSLIATFAMDWHTPMNEQRYAELQALAQRVGLRPHELAMPMQMAGPSVRMRTHLARALAFQPELLILFYPTERLDTASSLDFGRLVRRVCRDITLLLFTQNEPLAYWLCDRVVTIDLVTGQVQEQAIRRRWREWLRRWWFSRS